MDKVTIIYSYRLAIASFSVLYSQDVVLYSLAIILVGQLYMQFPIQNGTGKLSSVTTLMGGVIQNSLFQVSTDVQHGSFVLGSLSPPVLDHLVQYANTHAQCQALNQQYFSVSLFFSFSYKINQLHVGGMEKQNQKKNRHPASLAKPDFTSGFPRLIKKAAKPGI